MTIPARFSDPPFPCNCEALVEWLNARHGFSLAEGARLMGGVNADYLILKQVQERYGKSVPKENANGVPWPSDVWAAVVRWEREAGQPSLFEPKGEPS